MMIEESSPGNLDLFPLQWSSVDDASAPPSYLQSGRTPFLSQRFGRVGWMDDSWKVLMLLIMDPMLRSQLPQASGIIEWW